MAFGSFPSKDLPAADTPQIRADGVVRWPYGTAARSLIHERDIAAVAVRSLTSDEHYAAKYVLTGPASTDPPEFKPVEAGPASELYR